MPQTQRVRFCVPFHIFHMSSEASQQLRMSHSEIESGLGLLQRLVKEKDMNSGEMSYAHLPDCASLVMSLDVAVGCW